MQIQGRKARFMARLGTTAMAAIAVVALVAGTAVGAPRDDSALAKAADTMRKVGSARITGTINETTTVEGVTDFETGNADMTLTGLGGEGAVTHEILVDGIVYVDIAGSPGSPLAILSDGKPWLELGSVTSGGDGSGSAPALPTFDLLRGATGTTRVGTERVGGVKTTHYSSTLDPQAAIDASPASIRDIAAAAIAAFGDATVTSEVWIDGKHRVRRLSYTWTPGANAAAGLGPATVTYDFSKFGTKVDVQAPPPDQVSASPVFGP
jgi:hypothetical protein